MRRSVIDIVSDLELNRQAIAAAVDRDASGENDRAGLQKVEARLQKELNEAKPNRLKRDENRKRRYPSVRSVVNGTPRVSP